MHNLKNNNAQYVTNKHILRVHTIKSISYMYMYMYMYMYLHALGTSSAFHNNIIIAINLLIELVAMLPYTPGKLSCIPHTYVHKAAVLEAIKVGF